MQKSDAGSYSEASTVDPVILVEMFSQPKKSHLPRDCFAESKNLLCIVMTPNEPVFKDIWNISKLAETVCPRCLFINIKTQINTSEASTELEQGWDA